VKLIGKAWRHPLQAAQLASKPSVASTLPQETATVLYDYQAERDDEISLDVGVVVDVLSKEGDWVKACHVIF
jgi:hypothetical protein